MERFVLSYDNVLYIYPKLCLQVGFAFWLRPYLTNQYVILRYCSPNLCKWNYLYGDLPFYKIQVNRFMAWDESSGAKIIPKCILWMRGLVPLSFKTFPSFINRLLLLLSRFSHVQLWDPMDGSQPGSPVPGILQAREETASDCI